MGAENDIEVLETYTKYGPIILSADQSMQSDKVKIIHTNQRQTTYDAIQYLINKGYRNIAYCTDNNYYDHCFNKPRNVGFRVAMEDNGILETNGFSIMFIRLRTVNGLGKHYWGKNSYQMLFLQVVMKWH